MLSFLAPILAAILRHLLTCIAGVLVARGIIANDQIQPFVGSMVFGLGLMWSLWHKVTTPEMLAHLVARAATRTAIAKHAFVGATVVLASGAALASSAQAQNPYYDPPARAAKARGLLPNILPQISITQPSVTTPDALMAQLQQASIVDLQYAEALAIQAASVTPPTAGSTAAANRAKCYGAILQVLSTTTAVQASTTAIGGSAAPTTPSGVTTAFTRFEQLAQVADQLQPMSSVMTACAPVAQSIRMQTGQLVLGILGGGLSLAKLGIVP
jgi:hypothetical protein